jgi:tetratricopeptide (TPR) repeat protein
VKKGTVTKLIPKTWPHRVAVLLLLAVIIGVGAWILVGQNDKKEPVKDNPVAQEYQKRLPDLEKKVEQDPNSAAARIDLAVAQYATGDTEAAKKQYEKAVELDDSNATAYNNLGNVYRDLSDIDNAVKSYERAISLNPRLVNPYFNLANVQQYNQKKTADAIQTYQRALKALPDNEQIMLSLGLVYEATNDQTQAEQLYRAILAKNPENTAAKANLERIIKQ